MRDSKSLLLLLVSLLLVLVSFVLIWTWGYRYYNKNEDLSVKSKPITIDTSVIKNQVRDSLQKVFTETIQSLDSQLDSTLSNSDSLKAQLDVKLKEFYRLRNEITNILVNRNNNVDFTIAKKKIGELQNKVEVFRDKNQDVEIENKKLNNILNQLKQPTTVPEIIVKQPNNDSKIPVEKSNPTYPVFNASDMRLMAIAVNDDKETETNTADRAQKLTGSFSVTNYNSQLTNAEMFVVVIQPDGRALKTSGWESGAFNTVDGKKIYSYKLNFNYLRGEVKRLLFSLRADKLTKGNYTMEVYYNGIVIGRTVKTLS